MDAEVKIYRGRRGLSELGELWRGLVDRMEHRRFIHTWEWHHCFLEAQEPEPDRSLFVVVSAGDSPLAILPLRPVRRLSGVGRRGLEVPTNPHVPFSDIVVDDPVRLRAAMPAVLTRLVEESSVPWDYLAIRRTLGDSNAARCLRDVPGFPGRVSEAGGVHHISLRSYDELFSSLSSHFRNNLRRARKRAEALGGITYHTARSRQECEVLFPEFLEVEASGWKGEAGRKSAIALDGGLRRFYTSLMHSFADREQCRIDVVRHDGRPIAAAFQLVMDHTVYDLKIGFDESYARIAPGSLLHWYIFRTACEDPATRDVQYGL